MTALLADVGGTKTQLAQLADGGSIIHKAYYKNSQFKDFETLVQSYLAHHSTEQNTVSKAVIAVAGPVQDGKICTMTNLNWHINGPHLATQFGLTSVDLLNDLQASAWGFTDESINSKLTRLKGDDIDFNKPVVVISPGTGLGQACIFPDRNRTHDHYIIHPTEGGHKTLAPFNATIAQLINQHWVQHDQPVSWENWFSGSGLHRLYGALHPNQTPPSNEEMTRLALADPESPSGQCLTLFCQGIFAEAGNLALQYLSWGGVILAGGIPPKLKPLFQQTSNIAYFTRKNEYLDLLDKVPIALCEEEDIPLYGAAIYSQLT